MAALHLGKYRQLATQFDSAEERADLAENAINKMRVRGRSVVATQSATNGIGRSAVGD